MTIAQLASSRGRPALSMGCPWCGEVCMLTILTRSEEHTSELQSRLHLVCRLLLEKIEIGEDRDLMFETVGWAAPLLPADRARYFMGIGDPQGVLEVIERGIDMFDCVLPTRLGRTGSALTWSGRLNLKNAGFSRDPAPLQEGCACPACTPFSRAHIRHLVNQQELPGPPPL